MYETHIMKKPTQRQILNQLIREERGNQLMREERGDFFSDINPDTMRKLFHREINYDLNKHAPINYEVYNMGSAKKDFFAILESVTEKAIANNKYRNLKDE